MNKKNVLLGLALLVLGAGRLEAYQGKVDGYLSPDGGNYNVGDKFTTKVILNSGSGKISGACINLNVDTSKLKVVKVEVNRNKFSGVYLEKEEGGVVGLCGASSKTSTELPSGTVEMGSIYFEATATGSMNVGVKSSEIVGPSSSNDLSYELNWKASNFVIGGNDTGGLLKFKTTFAGVGGGANCANSWPVSVTVLKNGTNQNFSNVGLTINGEESGRKVYEGQVRVPGLVGGDKIAVFIKGSRNLQTKFGMNGQTGFYNKPGGEIVWQDGLVLDFTKYANLAGDVTGEKGVQDGSVDGIDFAYVKGEVSKRSEGDGMKADLNGNCKLESLDLTLLMLAMKDKQEQLY